MTLAPRPAAKLSLKPQSTRAVVEALLLSAHEIENHPHPTECDHLHSAAKVLRDHAAALASRAPAEPEPAANDASFQERVGPWMQACFGSEIAADIPERNHRFLEEALELVQSKGCSESEAMQLVRYVYGRPVGEPRQEVGGVMVTLAALCTASGLDLQEAAEAELARVWGKIESIRAKQAAKPKHSPLPVGITAEPDAWMNPEPTRDCISAQKKVDLATINGAPGKAIAAGFTIPLFAVVRVVPTVPPGWALVPKDPTPEMVTATDHANPPMGPPEHLTGDYVTRWHQRRHDANRQVWTAMLSTAPSLPGAMV